MSCLAGFSALGQTVRIISGRGGLVMVARAGEDFVVASDSAVLNADGTLSTIQKILPVGKNGALLLAGMVSLQDPVSKPVREEVNIARIAASWLAAHPEADIHTAREQIDSQVVAALVKFFSVRNPGAEANQYKFTLIYAGFLDEKPVCNATRYYLPAARGKNPRAEDLFATLESGEARIFSGSGAVRELLNGKSHDLSEFKADPAMRKLHGAGRQGLQAEDYLRVFSTTLGAAESAEGLKLDSGRAIISAPNKLATITRKDGFAWSNP
jgi:hypothetical protein